MLIMLAESRHRRCKLLPHPAYAGSNENIQFPVSISEQQAIVRKLDALSSETQRLEAIYQQKLNGLAELKQAVLQKAFAGELTAQPEQFLQEAVA
ncbi:MAG: hypothetical protein WA624_24395 [Methylocella sp.]